MAKTKKDFSTINSTPVYDNIAEVTEEQEQEQQYALKKTQDAVTAAKRKGKKETKDLRINMAFDPDNYEFIRIMATASGKNLTDFVNDIVTKTRLKPENQELLEQAKSFIDRLKV